MGKKQSEDNFGREMEAANDAMLQSVKDLNAALTRHHREAEQIEECITRDRTRKGKPLTEGGRTQLLRRLRGHWVRMTAIYAEQSDVCKTLAIHRDNAVYEALRERA